ncbi:hypothetical protein GJAV_G00249190 [Gymnothorax javanicus]|nr:hypothetical protein GJAV_G00249190 [Gymnothorax javanicus]
MSDVVSPFVVLFLGQKKNHLVYFLCSHCCLPRTVTKRALRASEACGRSRNHDKSARAIRLFGRKTLNLPLRGFPQLLYVSVECLCIQMIRKLTFPSQISLFTFSV